jgi:hypothetical protein
MKYLVRDGLGFIGSNVPKKILSQGHSVAIIDNLSTRYILNIPTEAIFTKGDVSDILIIEKFISTRVGDHRNWSNAKKHIVENMSILEIGCSSDFMLDKFKDEGYNICEIESSGDFLEFINNKS